MGAFIQVISEQELAIKACGRACADMSPAELPSVPLPAPVSLAALLRKHPDTEIELEWLDAMDASPTIH